MSFVGVFSKNDQSTRRHEASVKLRMLTSKAHQVYLEDDFSARGSNNEVSVLKQREGAYIYYTYIPTYSYIDRSKGADFWPPHRLSQFQGSFSDTSGRLPFSGWFLSRFTHPFYVQEIPIYPSLLCDSSFL